MSEYPIFPFWITDYMGDCAHLSDAEHGRYIQILFALWRSPEQRIPNDDEWLAHRFTRSVERVRTELRPIISEFCKTTGNWIWQERLVKEFRRVTERSKKQSVRAKSRWNNNKKNAVAMQPEPEPYINNTGEEKGTIWIAYGTKQGDAWALHFKSQGRIPPRDSKGGWWFPSEYPPEAA